MDWLKRLARRIGILLKRSRVEREMDEEMRLHIEMEIEDLMRRGMNREEARRQALVRFGGVERYKERGRDARGVRWLVDMGQDFRYATRTFRRNPGYTFVAALTLALGIGATTAIFSVVDGVLLKPLPYHEPGQLVIIRQQNSPTNSWPLSVVDYQAVEEVARSLESVSGLSRSRAILTGGDQPERIAVGYVTADWFNTLGVYPAEGRGFRDGEDRPGAERVAVISHAFRERKFGRDADVTGRTLVLDGVSYAVVGVLAPGVTSMVGWGAEIWPILQLQPPPRRGPFFIQAVGRLRDGISHSEAAQDLAGVSDRIFPLWAESFQDREARLTPFPLRDAMVGNVGGALALLFGAVVFVLLIALANVANLSLARASTREREVALRASLGASRGRLTRQLLVESVTLAALGGFVGTVLAFFALDALLSLGPQLPRIDEVKLDGRVLGFTGLITVASAVLSGLAPLIHGITSDLGAALRSGGRTGSDGRRANALRGALVTAEFALALPLLAGALLLFTSLERLQKVDPGFDPENLLVARASIAASRYSEPASVVQFWDRALPALAEIPGVAAVGLSSAAPPNSPGMINNFDLRDRPVPPGSSQPAVPWVIVSPGYFEAIGVRLLQGRLPDITDTFDTPRVVAVSSRWAARFYPGEDVLGRQLYAGGSTTNPVTVVGVVSDVKYEGLAGVDESVIYESYTQNPWRSVNLVIRGRGTSVTAAQVRGRLNALDPDVPLSNVQTAEQRLAASIDRPRYWATLVGIFAAAGLVLAAVGIYGVLSYSVSKQARDIGIRMALGAQASAVRRSVVGRAMGQAALGLGVGFGGALYLTRWLEGLLFGVSPTDPATFGLVVLLLLVVALAACYWPAQRATKVDPVRVLTEE
ncbi:MAG: FtsX-like permease family protein [Gemmatimonadetes bacterium]|nr:FtsX-like permease family protein [Gemmatimonadota bacterium]NIO31512.1 FtsX-like permease family protein [Gemmatimonadota bacterium]